MSAERPLIKYWCGVIKTSLSIYVVHKTKLFLFCLKY